MQQETLIPGHSSFSGEPPPKDENNPPDTGDMFCGGLCLLMGILFVVLPVVLVLLYATGKLKARPREEQREP